MKEILWIEAFGKAWRGIEYSSSSVPFEKAQKQAEELRDLLEEIRVAVARMESGFAPLFVKLTGGRYAGSIAQVTKLPRFNQQVIGHKIAPPRVHFYDNPSYQGNAKGQLTFEGHLYLSDYRGSGNVAIAKIDDKTVLEWDMTSPSMKTARPVLLLGYTGSTLLHRASKADISESSVKIHDRYGQPVVKGDLVIVGNSKTGELYVGKLERYTDARTFFVKHIGASESVKMLNVQDNQILRITDMDELKKLLMTEKLRSL